MTIIITAVGADKPGMVAAVSSILAQHRCNLEDCAMTRLGGQFAMILMVELPPQRKLEEIEPLFGALLQSHGLTVHCHPAKNGAALDDKPRHMLTVYAKDQPGLLSTISSVLAQHHVNITDVQTRLASSGELYVMLFEIEIPETLSDKTLEEHLQKAAREAEMTVTLRPIEEDIL